MCFLKLKVELCYNIALFLMSYKGHLIIRASLVVKNSPADSGDMSSITGLGRSPGERNGYMLQYSCLENPMDRGAWQVGLHRHNLGTKQ